ncbi:MAG: DUF1289 domain-containing protein [Rubrivivax sp.]|nr:MAG: DUF1289 domain-containing protein [Rubrivivax sp.]
MTHQPFPSSAAVTPQPTPSLVVASPCIRCCTLSDDDVCLGCGRTLAEITGWSGMNPAEQSACVQNAAARLACLQESRP